MLVRRLVLSDVRNYVSADLELAPGCTAVVGRNGQGKTNLVEALAFLATVSSFRGVPTEAMIRSGAERAAIRAELDREGRRLELEAELVRNGRSQVRVNRQRLARTRDLLGALRVTVFSPDDLALVKGGPGGRRDFLDDLLVALHPRHDETRADLDRVLRQRTSLLRQEGGRLSESGAFTLDVWDAKLAELGERLGHARSALVTALGPLVAEAYDELAGRASATSMRYDPPWRRVGLVDALAAARAEDVRRAQCTVGPHRDELDLSVNGLPARTHASQGEQRTLALALRVAGHRLVAERIGTPPVLLLDDVLSELDPYRSEALLRAVPSGQLVVTTAGALPPSLAAERIVHVEDGRLR